MPGPLLPRRAGIFDPPMLFMPPPIRTPAAVITDGDMASAKTTNIAPRPSCCGIVDIRLLLEYSAERRTTVIEGFAIKRTRA